MATLNTPRLTVLGAGAAGTAAAWFAARAGVRVLVVTNLPGATELYSGALDLEPWQELTTTEVDDDTTAFARALGVWTLERTHCRVATSAGVVRPVRGIDHALLDLEPLSGLRIAVLDAEREHYDGKLLARALEASDWAQRTGTRFEPVRVNVLRRETERRYSHHDFAELHDSPERVEWLAEQLNRTSSKHEAWLLGPWLGLDPETIAQLRLALLRPVGETTSLPGGAAGARFRRARDRLLSLLGVEVLTARISSLREAEDSYTLEYRMVGETADPLVRDLHGSPVVLALGGFVSGAIELAPLGSSGPAFRWSAKMPVELSSEGNPLVEMSTLHGPALVDSDAGALERVGIAALGSGAIPDRPQLFACGACLAGRPRSVLEATRSGIAAARAAIGRSVPPPPTRR